MTDIIQMPYEIMRQLNCDWDIDWRSQSAGEGTDGVEQIFMQMPRWTGTPSLALYDDLVKTWRAIRAKARGRVNVFRVPLIDYDTIRDAYGTNARTLNGTGLGDGPTGVNVGNRVAGATAITIAPGSVRPLVGSFLSVADWPYVVTDVTYEVSTRRHIASLSPPLRRAVPDGAIINFRAHGLFKATEDAMGAISVGANGFAQVDLSFREWLGPGEDLMDTRAEVIGVLHLVEITTTDGPFRFMLGVDGDFTDTNGNTWLGSTILGASERTMLIGDEAPRGSLTMTFMQDPSMEDVITQVKDLGVDYVYGLPVKFWVQPFSKHEELVAPVEAPRLMMTRKATGITFDIDGPSRRSISLAYEGIGSNGNHQLRRVYNTADHARLIGRQNPSLQYIPQAAENDEPLFG